MEFINLKGLYPVYVKKIDGGKYSVDSIIDILKNNIKEHPFAEFITVFDHYALTSKIDGHVLSEDILGAKDLIFCFGKELPVPEMLSIRPRSIGIAKTRDGFTISFMQAPNEKATQSMMNWVKAL